MSTHVDKNIQIKFIPKYMSNYNLHLLKHQKIHDNIKGW